MFKVYKTKQVYILFTVHTYLVGLNKNTATRTIYIFQLSKSNWFDIVLALLRSILQI